jgi:hypothetical protein
LDGHRHHPRHGHDRRGRRSDRRAYAWVDDSLAQGARGKIRVRYDRMIPGESDPLLVRVSSSPVRPPNRVDCRRPRRSSAPCPCPDGLPERRA